MWAHTADQPNFMKTNYQKLYPKVTVELTIIPANEHQQKVQNAVAAGNAPDIFTTKTDFIKYIVSTDAFYDNLLAAPYNAAHLSTNIFKEIVSLGSGPNGELRGLSWQVAAGAIWYRRGLAQKYFGSDDPVEVSKLFKDMDTMYQTAKTIKEKSGGTVKLIGDPYELSYFYRGLRQKPYVVGSKIVIDPALQDFFKMAKKYYDEGLDARVKQGDTNSVALMKDNKLFCYVYPTWGLTNNISLVLPETSGDWGIADNPVGWTQGGTWMGIYSKSKNKELAYTFVNYVFANEEFVYNYAVNFGDYVSNVAIQEKIGKMTAAETEKIPIFKVIKNQNFYSYFNKELKSSIGLNLTTEYDFNILPILRSSMEMYVSGQKTFEDSWKSFAEDIIEAYPKLSYDGLK